MNSDRLGIESIFSLAGSPGASDETGCEKDLLGRSPRKIEGTEAKPGPQGKSSRVTLASSP